MDELKDFFEKIIKSTKIKDENYEIILQERHESISIEIDYLFPEEARSHRRSATLIFRYSQCFLEDNKDIIKSTSKKEIQQIINNFDFTTTSLNTNSVPPKSTWVIQSNGKIAQEGTSQI